MDNWKDDSKKWGVIKLEENMEKNIELLIKSSFPEEANYAISFIKQTTTKGDKKNSFQELISKVYGRVYQIIIECINEKIGNEIHHHVIKFKSKKDLKEQIKENKKLNVHCDGLVEKIWNYYKK